MKYNVILNKIEALQDKGRFRIHFFRDTDIAGVEELLDSFKEKKSDSNGLSGTD